MYNLLMANNTTVESIKAALGAWFLVMYKKAAINYLEYDPDTGRVSFLDNFDKEDQGTEPQEAIVEGLLDLFILNKSLDIHRGGMASGRYFNSNNKDMS